MDFKRIVWVTALTTSVHLYATAQTTTAVKHIQTETGLVASAVWAGDTLYVSGQLPSAVIPADVQKGVPAVYGDTRTQATSALGKIKDLLKEQGLGMADVVMMHVYMVGDPDKGGKLDFAGMNEAFKQYFGTKEQPAKPARSAMQVAALAIPGPLVEIEAIAVKAK